MVAYMDVAYMDVAYGRLYGRRLYGHRLYRRRLYGRRLYRRITVSGITGIPLIFPLYFRVITLLHKSDLFPRNYVGLEIRESGITCKTE